VKHKTPSAETLPLTVSVQFASLDFHTATRFFEKLDRRRIHTLDCNQTSLVNRRELLAAVLHEEAICGELYFKSHGNFVGTSYAMHLPMCCAFAVSRPIGA
jgi:hypothetical protein